MMAVSATPEMSKEIFFAWHGSPHVFDRFDFSKLRDALGVFFTNSKESAEYYGSARQYCLIFRNVLHVHQGEEYVRWIANRDGEKSRDVRLRLINAGHDGIRMEYHNGMVEYVAFSNRNIIPIKRQCTMLHVTDRTDSGNSLHRV